jgi:hypothetical protein
MKGGTDTWEEQYAQAKLKIRIAIDNFSMVQECCQRKLKEPDDKKRLRMEEEKLQEKRKSG